MGLKAVRRPNFASLSLSLKYLISVLLFSQLLLAVASDYPFRNPLLPWDERVEDLVGRLTLDEKISQMSHGGLGQHGPAPPIPRLEIGPYQWGTECLSGDVQAGNATSFPMSIGMAASFDSDLLFRVARATGIEVRAKYNNYTKHGYQGDHTGLSCWSPVINIMRHPLWGRNQETYGEDPYLSGSLGQSFVRGLQGDHPRYVLANGGCKHFDVYAGPEDIPVDRKGFNAEVSEHDWRVTFLPAFQACVEAGTYSLMCSYNRINGVPACANKKLLTDILRKEWGFKGYVVSDEGAIEYMIYYHKYTNTTIETAAAAVNAGCNLELTSPRIPKSVYSDIGKAIQKGLIAESTVNELVKPLYYTRMRLGEFDPPEMNPYTKLDLSVIQSKEHQLLALESSEKSFILLKNRGNLLPLNTVPDRIAVVGPFANTTKDFYGDYSPDLMPGHTVTPLMGVSSFLTNKTQSPAFASGCYSPLCLSYDAAEVKRVTQNADLVIVCLGTGILVEAEARDRVDLKLPGYQLQLLQDAHAAGKPTILVLYNAGPLDISWAQENVDAILENFLPAQTAGIALAHVLSGKVNPAGRLPATWPASMGQVPPMVDYSMEGRTYRYFKGDPLYPFGYGLSYSQFYYHDLVIDHTTIKPCENVTLSATVDNTGDVDGDEVVQVYISWGKVSVAVPKLQLVGFSRIHVLSKKSAQVSFAIKAGQMAVYKEQWQVVPATIHIFTGGQQPHQKTAAPSNVLEGKVEIQGKPTPLKMCNKKH